MKKLLTLLAFTIAFTTIAQCPYTPSLNAFPVTSPGIDYYLIGNNGGAANAQGYLYIQNYTTIQADSTVYTFPGSGTYNVCYMVNDSASMCSDSVCTVITVNGGGATNCQVYIYYILPNGNAQFQAQPVLAPGWTATYAWNFGDGNTATGQNVTHGFWAPGNYNVSVTMTAVNPADTTESCTVTKTEIVTVTSTNNCNLQAVVNAQPDSTGSLNYLITAYTINASSNATYTITVDGNSFYNTDTVYYTFGGPGYFNVTYTAFDSTAAGLCSDSAYISIQAGAGGNGSCSTSFWYGNNGNGTLAFYASSGTSPAWNTNYAWDFGDGTSGSGSNINHTYSNNGAFTVVLTMSSYNPADSTQYCYTTFVDSVYINNSNGGNCISSVNYTPGANGAFTFNSNGSTAYTSYTTLYYWTVDGNYITNTQSFNHTFSGNGTHNVCVTVVYIDTATNDSCFTSACTNVSWYDTCSASFVLIQDSVNTTVYSGYNLSTGNNLSYLWDFGDGTTSTSPYPYHNYTVTGYYLICLTVYDSVTSCTHTYCDSAGTARLMQGGISSMTIYPNPTLGQGNSHEQFNFNIVVAPNPLNEASTVIIESDKAKKLTLQIVNTLGQIVDSRQLNISAGKNNVQLNASSLSDGMYFLQVSDGNSVVETIKILK